MFNIGPQELLLVLIVALIIVGPKRLPDLGRTIGRGLNEFRKIQDEVKDMVKFDLGADPADAPDEPSPVPTFSDEHDDDVQDHHGHDHVDTAADEDNLDDEDDDADDGMTHSERVIAAMDDGEAVVEPDVEADARPVTPAPELDEADIDGSSTDLPPAAAAE